MAHSRSPAPPLPRSLAPHPPQVAIFALLFAGGSSWFDAAAVITNVRNFPHSRGLVVGLLKALLGLSAGILAQFYLGVFTPNVSSFLLFLACVVPCAALTFGMLLSPQPEPPTDLDEQVTPQWFGASYGLTILLAAFLAGTSLLEHLGHLHAVYRQAITVVAVVLALSFWGLVPLHRWLAKRKDSALRQYLLVGEEEVVEEVVEEEVAAAEGGEEGGSPAGTTSARTVDPDGTALLHLARDDSSAASEEAASSAEVAKQRLELAVQVEEDAALLASREMVVARMLLHSDFWMLFVALVVGMGAGVMVINNVAQLVKSLSDAPPEANATPALGGPAVPLQAEAATVYVSLLSVANCSGRMLGGFATDALAKRFARPVFITCSLLLMAATHALLAVSDAFMLYFGVVLVGLAYGSMWAMVPSVISELFGLKHFASNYTVASTAPSLGSLLLSAQLAARVYDSHARVYEDGNTECYGHQCYRATFVFISLACLLAALLCAAVVVRTRPLYAALRRTAARRRVEVKRLRALRRSP